MALVALSTSVRYLKRFENGHQTSAGKANVTSDAEAALTSPVTLGLGTRVYFRIGKGASIVVETGGLPAVDPRDEPEGDERNS